MQFYLHQILPLIFLPIGITLLLALAGLFLKRRSLILIGVVVLWLSSTPLISNFAVRYVEGWALREQAIDMPRVDAIVVLSEGRIIAPGVTAVSEWLDADRFYGGVELFKAGRAPLLIFTGGWSPQEPKAKPEGEILKGFAKSLGISDKAIVTTGKVVNTEEEAQSVATLLIQRNATDAANAPPSHILLVTSAFHMSRAKQMFEHAGMEVTPFPVDFKVPDSDGLAVTDFFPRAGALERTECICHEIYGRLYFWVRSFH